MELLNQFGVDVDVFEIEYETEDGVTVRLRDDTEDETIVVGDEVEATVDVECSAVGKEPESATVFFDVGVLGQGVSAETMPRSRDVTITCPETVDAAPLEPREGTLGVGPGLDKGVPFTTVTNDVLPGTVEPRIEITRHPAEEKPPCRSNRSTSMATKSTGTVMPVRG